MAIIHVECIIVKFPMCLYSYVNSRLNSCFQPSRPKSLAPLPCLLFVLQPCFPFGLPLRFRASVTNPKLQPSEPTHRQPHPRTGGRAKGTLRHNPALVRQLFELQYSFGLCSGLMLRRNSCFLQSIPSSYAPGALARRWLRLFSQRLRFSPPHQRRKPPPRPPPAKRLRRRTSIPLPIPLPPRR